MGVLFSTGAGGNVEDSLGDGAGVVTLGSGDGVTILGVGVTLGVGLGVSGISTTSFSAAHPSETLSLMRYLPHSSG